MPRRCSLFVLGLIFLAASGLQARTAHGQQGYSVTAPPEWVGATDFDDRALPSADQAAGGFYYLLIDTQVRVDGRESARYSRYAIKVLDEEGIDQAAQFSISFDPAYQRLSVHQMGVRRDGTYHDRLRHENISLLHREPDLERRIYDGRKTASIVLEDVRVGDVVEYSFTVAGANPVFGGRFADGFYTDLSVPVHRLRYRVLWPAGRTLHVKSHGTAPAPVVSRSEGVIEYRWDQAEVRARHSEGDTPPWFDTHAWVQLSEWESWSDVVAWAEPMYRPTTSGVRSVAAQIASQAEGSEAQLLAALRYVQEEIRYVSFSMAQGSHEPRPPATTLRRRFGDCKDKAVLLVSLLEALGVEAYSAFVHSDGINDLFDWHPTPLAFDHVIVFAYLDGRRFWLDPTQRHQRGNLENLHQPGFGRALVIRPGEDDLEVMDPPRLDRPDKVVEETFDLTAGVGQAAAYTVRSIYRGSAADRKRAWLARQSRQEIQTSYVNYYSAEHATIEVAEGFEIRDDDQRNRLTVEEHYAIPGFWKRQEVERRMRAEIFAKETNNLLYRPWTSQRTEPLAIRHPYHQVQTIRVLLPEPWPIQPETLHIEDAAIAYSSAVEYTDDVLTLRYEYRTKTSYIRGDQVPEHLRNVDAISDDLVYQLFSYDEGAGGLAPNWPLVLLTILTIVLAVQLARRLYLYEPVGMPLAPEERDPDYQGLGGWLIVVGFGIVISPFVQLYAVGELLSVAGPVEWNLLTNPASDEYHPLWAPAIIFGLVANSALLVGVLLAAILFFKRRSSFPRVYGGYLILAALLSVGDAALTTPLPAVEGAWGEAGRQLIFCAIWVSYLRTSKRVESTFVNRRSPNPAAGVLATAAR